MRVHSYDLPNAARRAVELVRRDGLLSTASGAGALAADSLLMPFDRRHGTDTGGLVDPELLAVDSVGGNGAVTHHYQAINALSFRGFLRSELAAPEGRFVDFGCGKGRALMLAAAHGFTSVSGVEHSISLATTARANLRRFTTTHLRGRTVEWEVALGDAAEWAIPDDTSVAFFYNPFPHEVLARVLDRLADSVTRRPRSLTIVYQSLPDDASLAEVCATYAEVLTHRGTVRSWGKSYHLFAVANDRSVSGGGRVAPMGPVRTVIGSRIGP